MKWLIVLASFCYGMAFAQKLPIRHYTTREGLVQMQIMSLFKDSRGYIWVGTKGGLSKFNGETFENFTTKDGLATDEITYIAEDKKGILWLENGRALTSFDGRTFKTYKAAENVHYDSRFTLDEHDVPLLTLNGKLYRAEGDTLLPHTLHAQLGQNIIRCSYNSSLGCYLVHTINRENDTHSLYVVKNKRLTRIETGTYKIGLWDNALSLVHLYIANKQVVATLEEKPNGDFELKPIFEFSTTEKRIVKWHQNAPADFVVLLQEKYLLAQKNTQTIQELCPDYPFTSFNNQSPIIEKGKVWIGTEKGLLAVFTNGFRYFDEKEVPYAWGVVEDQPNDYYFLNYGTSLQRYHNQKVNIVPASALAEAERQATLKYGRETKINNGWYYNPFKDKFGKLWLPGLTNILVKEGNKWEIVYNEDKSKEASFFNICEDPKRNKVVGSGYGHIVVVNNKPPYHTANVADTAIFFKNNRLMLCLKVSPTGEYWIGAGRGVCRYNPDTKQFKYYEVYDKNKKRQPIGALCFDNHGTLWAGSFEEGLYRFDAKNDAFVPVFEELTKGFVLTIGQLDATHLLFTDFLNMYVLDLKAYYETGKTVVKAFNHHNGFMGLEPGQNGLFVDSKGLAWLTSSSVLSQIDPTKLNLLPEPLAVFVRKINGERLPFVIAQSYIHKLPHRQNTVEITAEAIGSDKSFFSEYSYWLEGESKQWSDWQKEAVIRLTNLNDGVHTLRIRSRRGTTIAQLPEAAIRFSISLPFWQWPNFYVYAGFLLFLSALLIGYLGWRSNRNQAAILKQGQLLLQKQQENEQQAQLLNRQQQQNRRLEAQAAQAQMSPHFIFNLLASIQTLIVKGDTKESNRYLGDMAKIMRDFLEYSIAEDSSLERKEITIGDEMRLIKRYIEFEKLQYGDTFEYGVNISDDLENYDIPPLLIQPLVENAIKHGIQIKYSLDKSYFGHLHITITTDEDESLIVNIEDDR